MSNVLSEEKRQQVIALGRLGWPLRRIQQETGIRRETAGAYLKAAGIAIRAPGGWGRRAPAKPANEVSPDLPIDAVAEPDQNRPTVSPDSAPISLPGRCPTSSACEPYFDFIELSLSKGRNAKAIYQDLVDSHGFAGRYASVKRFVRRLRGQPAKSACAVIVTPPAEEAQVDYGSGPMVRDSHSGRYRRTRLFVLTLGYSRKAVRLLTFQSSTRTWAELHEQAFRRLGGVCRTIVLDNLSEGVLKPDIHDPELNPLYRDMLTHYGAIYEDRLACEPHTAGRVIVPGAHPPPWMSRSAGLIYAPVEHEGNVYESAEEEEQIARLVQDLTALQVRDKDGGIRGITADDVLVVAPYNLQVRRLERRLHPIRVGTVDKFQGQEAAVIIFSMTASTGDAPPRGIEFLFSRNRLNVAISRAQTMAIVVASSALIKTRCSSIDQIQLLNMYCRAIFEGSAESTAAAGRML